MKRINIIARYKEDLDWAKDLQGDIIVYNKGEDWKWDLPVRDVPNYGREAETNVDHVFADGCPVVASGCSQGVCFSAYSHEK